MANRSNDLTISATSKGRIAIRSYMKQKRYDPVEGLRHRHENKFLSSRIINENDIQYFEFPDKEQVETAIQEAGYEAEFLVGPFCFRIKVEDCFERNAHARISIYPRWNMYRLDNAVHTSWVEDEDNYVGVGIGLSTRRDNLVNKCMAIIGAIRISIDKMVEKGWIEQDDETLSIGLHDYDGELQNTLNGEESSKK